MNTNIEAADLKMSFQIFPYPAANEIELNWYKTPTPLLKWRQRRENSRIFSSTGFKTNRPTSNTTYQFF